MFKAGAAALPFFCFSQNICLCLAEIAESAERFSPDGEKEVTQKSRKTQKWLPSASGCFAALGVHRWHRLHGLFLEVIVNIDNLKISKKI